MKVNITKKEIEFLEGQMKWCRLNPLKSLITKKDIERMEKLIDKMKEQLKNEQKKKIKKRQE